MSYFLNLLESFSELQVVGESGDRLPVVRNLVQQASLGATGSRQWEVLRFRRYGRKRDCWGRDEREGYFGLKGFFMANVDRSLFGGLR